MQQLLQDCCQTSKHCYKPPTPCLREAYALNFHSTAASHRLWERFKLMFVVAGFLWGKKRELTSVRLRICKDPRNRIEDKTP